MHEIPIATVGEVLEHVSDRLFRVRLKNGKEVLAFTGKVAMATGIRVEGGDRVALEMTPYDFSKARIVRVVGAAEPEA